VKSSVDSTVCKRSCPHKTRSNRGVCVPQPLFSVYKSNPWARFVGREIRDSVMISEASTLSRSRLAIDNCTVANRSLPSSKKSVPSSTAHITIPGSGASLSGWASIITRVQSLHITRLVLVINVYVTATQFCPTLLPNDVKVQVWTRGSVPPHC